MSKSGALANGGVDDKGNCSIVNVILTNKSSFDGVGDDRNVNSTPRNVCTNIVPFESPNENNADAMNTDNFCGFESSFESETPQHITPRMSSRSRSSKL